MNCLRFIRRMFCRSNSTPLFVKMIQSWTTGLVLLLLVARNVRTENDVDAEMECENVKLPTLRNYLPLGEL